jgi:hypothetical protein
MISPRLSLAALRWIFVGTILLSSIQTLVQASGLARPASPAVAALASLEIVAIVAFTMKCWRRRAAVVLVLIFAVAFVGSAVHGEFAARFVYFAASAVYLKGSKRARDPPEPSFA